MEAHDIKRLRFLSHAGLLLDESGYVHDNIGSLASKDKTDKQSTRKRNTFTLEDDEVLHQWVSRAQDEGLPPRPNIFEELASIVRAWSMEFDVSSAAPNQVHG